MALRRETLVSGQPRVYLYGEPNALTLDLGELCRYVKETLPGLVVQPRAGFLSFFLDSLPSAKREEALPHLAEQIARAKVRDPFREKRDFVPLPGEVAYESRRLAQPQGQAFGLLYDGLELGEILRGLIPKEEASPSQAHIVFTNQLFGTWEESDHRYHLRVSLYSFPSLLSTSGLVEAPAKPREYYLLKQQYLALKMTDAAAVGLDPQFRGRFIDHDDPRLTEVMKGYVMQALFYHFWGEPFCPDRGCRFYNAHWQEEVIYAQLESPYEFCPKHQQQLEEWRRNLVSFLP